MREDNMIRKIQFEGMPFALSAVCLGCARFGGDYDEARSFALLDRYYAMGGRFFDTANVYGRWSKSGLNESELTLGRWLKARQITDAVITSKCCHYAPNAHDVSRVNRASAEADLEESRRSLGLDTIPIYLTHRDNPAVDIREIVDFLWDMVKAGRVARFGFSNYKADRVRAALDYLGPEWPKVMAGVSNEWSLHAACLTADAGGEREAPDGMVTTGRSLEALHREKNLPLLAFAASGGGFYTKLAEGRIPLERAGAADRAVMEKLKTMSAERGVSLGALSLAWVLNAGLPAVPISAVSDEKQLEDFEAASSWMEDLSCLSPLCEIG